MKVLLLLWLLPCVSAMAQTVSDTTKVYETVPFWKRFSVHTNALEWALTVPNLGLEFDLGKTENTRYSLLFTGKYNGQTEHTIQPRWVFNVIAAQVEVRKYWRTGGGEKVMDRPEAQDKEGKDTIGCFKKAFARDTTVNVFTALFRKFRHNRLSGRTISNQTARVWRAYYVGLYVGADKYTINLGGDGKMGRSLNGGVSFGFTMPMYAFKGGSSVDLDLGVSVGGKMTKYWNIGYDEETACYTNKAGDFKSWHIVPYPVVHEIRVGVAYRFNSIGNKVKNQAERYKSWYKTQVKRRSVREDSAQARYYRNLDAVKARKAEKKAEVYADSLADLRKAFVKDSTRQARLEADSLADVRKNFIKDSLRAEKLARRLEEAYADSMAEVRKDSLKQLERAEKQARKMAEAYADSLKEVSEDSLKLWEEPEHLEQEKAEEVQTDSVAVTSEEAPPAEVEEIDPTLPVEEEEERSDTMAIVAPFGRKELYWQMKREYFLYELKKKLQKGGRA